MKNVILMCLSILILLSGCNNYTSESLSNDGRLSNEKGKMESVGKQIPSKGINAYKNTLRKALLETEIIPSDRWNKETVEQAKINIETTFLEEIVSTAEKTECVLLSLEDKEFHWILTISNNDVAEYKYIGSTFGELPEIYFSDIDGDKVKEIIVHCGTVVSGSTGPYYESSVFKYEETIQTIYSRIIQPAEIEMIDLGFEVLFCNQYHGIIKNRFTDMEIIFNTSKYPLYNSNGDISDPTHSIQADMVLKNIGPKCNFRMFEPVDINDDGVDEIMVNEAFLIDYQFSPSIGMCYAILRYDSQMNDFDIIQSSFIPEDYTNKDYSDINWYGEIE